MLYISEVLDITEQELFNSDIEYSSEYNVWYSKEAKEILDLLKFAPKSAIEEIRNYLIKYKDVQDSGIGKG